MRQAKLGLEPEVQESPGAKIPGQCTMPLTC